MPSKPKQTTKEILAENPELQLPKIILQSFGLLILGGVVAKFLMDSELSKTEGLIMAAVVLMGALLVIPKVIMPVLRMIKGWMPTFGGK